jgi:hypothetical protein
MSRPRPLVLSLIAAAVLLAGCGGSTGDDFLLQRLGQGPGARLSLVVGDSGTVSCNRGKSRELPSARLLDARTFTREVSDDATMHKRYPAREGSILRYRIKTQDGTVTWADTSRPLPERYLQLAFFARRVSTGVCGLNR